LAFSKELLPVGTRFDGSTERPRAVSEYLLERMMLAGVTHICFVISSAKSDIMNYFGGHLAGASICYAVQQNPNGLCDALFRALPFIDPEDEILVGLPDTVWFPDHGFLPLRDGEFSFLLFPVAQPELFDAVVTNENGSVQEIQVKQANARTQWVWGAFKLTGHHLASLYRLWCERSRQDQYLGTLVNAYIENGGTVFGVKQGDVYVDVGTLHGYREALRVLTTNQMVGNEVKR
jgi:dTDP-glucose pyrophosphorylase